MVVRDLFPALVTLPGRAGAIRDARVVVTRERVYVWQWLPAGPDLVFTEVFDQAGETFGMVPNAPPTKPLRVELPAGRLEVTWAGGCGCGNPLRSWSPWSPWLVGTLR